MPELPMPRLSDSMQEGTIIAWLKAEGEEVAVGEELVEIETDKANMAYESDLAGTLTEILAPAGETLPIGAPIARIGAAEDGAAERAGAVAAAGDPPSPAVPEEASPGTGTPAPPPAAGADSPRAEPPPAAGARAGAGGGRAKASPLARRLAGEAGIDLARLEGSGPGGRIVKADVRAAAGPAAPPAAAGPASATRRAEPAPAPGQAAEGAKGAVEVIEPSKLQRTIARRMAESKATAPHFYLTTEVEMSAAVKAREALREAAGRAGAVPSFNDIIIKACALALREHPKANSAYRDGRFELYSRVNVGFAVAAPGSLVVPTVFDADRKGLGQIAAEARELAAKVKDRSITPPELSGATFTVSNLGMHGVTRFEAVLNLPQAAILAVGAITAEPRFDQRGELYRARPMSITLSCDHRVLYGAEGAALLARVRELLEAPLALAL